MSQVHLCPSAGWGREKRVYTPYLVAAGVGAALSAGCVDGAGLGLCYAPLCAGQAGAKHPRATLNKAHLLHLPSLQI